MATHPKKAIPKTPMQAFAQASSHDHIALLLWKGRIENPDLSVQITEADLKAFHDCMTYLKVEPEVKVFEHRGRTVIALLEKDSVIKDKKTGEVVSQGNAIRPVENNEADFAKSQQAENYRMVKQGATQLAVAIRNQAAQGEFSADMIQQAAETIMILASRP